MKRGAPESLFEKEVYEILIRTGLKVIINPAIGGARPDFLVQLPDGSSAVIEVKNWGAAHGGFTRAKQQVEYYKKLSGAEYAFVVIGGATKSFESEGVISIKDLPKVLTDLAERIRQRKTKVSSLLLRVILSTLQRFLLQCLSLGNTMMFSL